LLGAWIALLCVILGGFALAAGLASHMGGYIVLGVLLFVAAGIGGAKGSFVRHDAEGHGHH
jgi:hypothetical protein